MTDKMIKIGEKLVSPDAIINNGMVTCYEGEGTWAAALRTSCVWNRRHECGKAALFRSQPGCNLQVCSECHRHEQRNKEFFHEQPFRNPRDGIFCLLHA
mmetsp:Transcript_13416/g.28121  ORF Transcript_13416/g.28121 Transcript_13416/m.28121 type:complete len:99 (-) Transcript_13416:687-983(-)